MTRSADSASRLVRALGAAGLAALLIISLASPGATRMHAWPWSLAYALALAAPVAALLLRAFDRTRPLVLPSCLWCIAAFAGAVVVLLSALASPYRGPSLLWSTPLLAGIACFLVGFDWLYAAPDAVDERRNVLLKRAGLFFAVVALASLGLWATGVPGLSAAEIFNARNPHPLGHSNYTAGLALLMLPCFAVLAWRAGGIRRLAWSGAMILALGMLFTSGSRGGFVGFAALLLGTLLTSGLGWRKSLALAAAAGLAGLLLALAHPRTRAIFTHSDPGGAPNASNVQRAAMFEAGLAMGLDRPLLGWGPGTTPLAYPRFRHALEGGVENVLQLHSLPVQLWAECGALGLAAALAFTALVLRSANRHPVAAVALAGYAVFSLTDWQLDVPVFAFALALFAALLAPPAEKAISSSIHRVIGFATLVAPVLVGAFGRNDPSPRLNVRALALALDPARQEEAATLLDQSLALNPDQEIAHFNLGWLLVVRDPPTAEKHFLAAAHLVPDKGGVYFGLGLARLNQGHRDGAVRAFALECVNDPVFLTSPWWRDPSVGAIRPAVMKTVLQLLDEARSHCRMDDVLADTEADYLTALIPWLEGKTTSGEMLAHARTPERVAYFSRRLPPPDFFTAPLRTYRRERAGYPVLMRNLDLPTPVDLLDVQENSLATGEFRFLFPRKGWLPGPLLILLLEERTLEAE